MNKKFSVESTFLGGAYKNKRKLGKGAFGDVFLVQNTKKELFALKVIDKQKMSGDNEDMIQYLRDQKTVMEKMNHRNLVKLYDFNDDQEYYYMVLQYCDGGDLVNLQATYPNRVFSLANATQYLAQVIYGLEELHTAGYLHRDIKLQNVLLKNQNGVKIFKVADFGFAKKAKNSSGTVLGTQQYMSPQIYRCGIDDNENENDVYGYQVDMWAFGVLIYYMLNMAFPFEINPHWTIEMKYQELTKQAENFSYKKAVMATSRKIKENCTEQMEDLFRKIFNTNVDKRITFHQIRQHPVFAKHFPGASVQSKILYNNKFVSSRVKKGKLGVTNNLVAKQAQLQKKNFGGVSSICAPDEQKDYPVQKQILRLQIQEISFLCNMVEEIQIVQNLIGISKSYMFAYNLIKYYIILLNGHLKNLSPNYYMKKYKHLNLNWLYFFDTDEFKATKRQLALKISKGQMRFQELYAKCKCQLKQIVSLNDSFKAAFDENVDPAEIFDGDFHRSYRKSTDILYTTLKDILKTKKLNEYYFFLCAVCICHVFNEFYENPTLKQSIFSAFLSQQTQKSPIFSYERLVYYLKRCGKQALVLLTRKLIEEVMMKC